MKTIQVVDGKISVGLYRAKKSNVSAKIYEKDNAWSDSEVVEITEVGYENGLYVFHLGDDLKGGSEYIIDIFNNGVFTKGYVFQTQEKIKPELEESEAEKEYRKSDIQQLANELLVELDRLIAEGYYYSNEVEIPSNIIEDIEKLSIKLRNLHLYMEGDVAQDAYLLRNELSQLKHTISRENETQRRYNLRPKKINLTEREVFQIADSVTKMLADKLNTKMGEQS